MAKPRKKFNHAASTDRLNSLIRKNYEARIKEAFKGAMLAYNSSWEDIHDDEAIERNEAGEVCFYNTGLQKVARVIAKYGDSNDLNVIDDDTRRRSVTTQFAWRFYITINCETQDGEQYAYVYPIKNIVGKMENIEDEIEAFIKSEVSKRNQAHVKDWGYWGEIV